MDGPHGTDQENFWVGDFGRSYRDRNRGADWVGHNLAFFGRALSRVQRLETVLELGANIGLNMSALRQLHPCAALTALEINAEAATELGAREPTVHVVVDSLLTHRFASVFDLVFTKGVLIHVHPDKLSDAYDQMARSSARYVLIAEYYNPSPVSIQYRGHDDRLFKRDFAGEFLDRHEDFELRDYGFVYHRDPIAPQDDLNWFLLERRAPASLPRA